MSAGAVEEAHASRTARDRPRFSIGGLQEWQRGRERRARLSTCRDSEKWINRALSLLPAPRTGEMGILVVLLLAERVRSEGRIPRARRTPHHSLPLYPRFLLPNFTLRPLPEPNNIILVLDPDKPADNQGKNEEFLPLFVHDRHDRKAREGCQRTAG